MQDHGSAPQRPFVLLQHSSLKPKLFLYPAQVWPFTPPHLPFVETTGLVGLGVGVEELVRVELAGLTVEAKVVMAADEDFAAGELV